MLTYTHLIIMYLCVTPAMLTRKTVLSLMYQTPLIPNNHRNNTQMHVCICNIILLKTMSIINYSSIFGNPHMFSNRTHSFT